MLPSLRQTMSLGEFSRLPSNLSTTTSTWPFASILTMRRLRDSHTYRRPLSSTLMPAGPPAFSRKRIAFLFGSTTQIWFATVSVK